MTAADVISGARRWSAEAGDNLAWLMALPDGCCQLCMFSPPYESARAYNVGFTLRGQAWVDWLAPRIIEMARVTAGLVLCNAAGQVRQHSYSPVVEWLVADMTRRHGLVCGPAPYCYFRFGVPGSGSKHYHRRDWEPVYAFCRPEVLPLGWSANTAEGRPPRWAPGGEMSNRLASGARAGKVGMARRRSGATGEGTEPGRAARNPHPAIANPGNVVRERYDAEEVRQMMEALVTREMDQGDVIRCLVGGGTMGSRLAHENEAPYPERLAELFVRSYAPPGAIVMDPFCGSGTTGAVSVRLGRRFVGCDLRPEMAALTARRLSAETPTAFP